MTRISRRKDRPDDPFFYLRVRDRGRQRRIRLAIDRRTAERIARRKLDELEDWDGKSAMRRHMEAPIGEHVDAFLLAMEAGSLSRKRGRPTAGYIRSCRRTLEAALHSMAAATIADLLQDAADAYLARLMRAGRAAKTRDDVALLLKQYGAWLVRTERLLRNPFAEVRPTATEADVTKERRALREGELQRLIRAAEERPSRCVLPGQDRGCLYTFAARTGLRLGECRALRWLDLDLDGRTPVVTVRATHSKNRRTQSVPLLHDVVDALARMRVRKFPVQEGDHVFRIPTTIVDHLTRDAHWANLDGKLSKVGASDGAVERLVDGAGRILDFHSLRVTCATIMAQTGVSPQVAQKVMRHSAIEMTLRHYTKLDMVDLHRALGQVLGHTARRTRSGAGIQFRGGETA